MEHVYSLGWLILLPVFLLIILFQKKSQTKPTNIPTGFKTALAQALKGSKYQNLIEFWYAVSKMETGGFTSDLYLKYNNPWGMKAPQSRQTTANNKGSNGWAHYNTIADAAKDIVLWMNAKSFVQSVNNLEDFIAEMKSNGYFEEPYEHYLNLVKAWEKR